VSLTTRSSVISAVVVCTPLALIPYAANFGPRRVTY